MIIKGNVLVKVTDDDIMTGTFSIPNYIKKIGEGAFKYCEKLICVVMSESVEEIAGAAFKNCENLEKINLSYGITKIEFAAFSHCKSLQQIIIPNSVTKIDNYAFSNCESLTSITLPDSLITIGESAFSNCKSLQQIVIPNSVTTIGKRAFYKCENLTGITLSDKLTTIEEGTFAVCVNLKKVVVPESVKCIEKNVFDVPLHYTYYSSKKKLVLVLPTTLIGFDVYNNSGGIYLIKVGRTVIKNELKFFHIRKKEILNEIKEKLKIRGINSKCYFKYEEHEVFIQMMLNELNKGIYINFEHQLDNYINEFLKSKDLKIESHKDIPLKYDDEMKKEENFEYSNETLLQENQKINETNFGLLSNSDMSNEIMIESNSMNYEVSQIENIQQENDIKVILKKLSELPTEDISLIMDLVKNNLFDPNIEKYINIGYEEKLKILELKSYKVNLEKEPIEEYKARQKVKH